MSDGLQLVGGVWLPETETHLVSHMSAGKGRVERDGKLTYQIAKLDAAMLLVPSYRRRLALDVGAHVGLWSMWLANQFSNVDAFEPVPLLRAAWQRNVEASNAVLWPYALGNDRRVVDFQMPLETTGNSHVAIKGQHPGTRGVAHPERVETVTGVEMRRLDDLVYQNVDFVKIDCEGYEKHVVLGGEQTIRRDKPIIVVEQKGNDAAYGDEPKAALRLLEKWGAKVAREMSGDFLMVWA